MLKTRREILTAAGYKFDFKKIRVCRESGSDVFDIYMVDRQPTGRRDVRVFGSLTAEEASDIKWDLLNTRNPQQFEVSI